MALSGLALQFSEDTDAEQRRQLLLSALSEHGACVMTNRGGGHMVAVIIPDVGQVEAVNAGAVWAAVIELLRQALDAAQRANAESERRRVTSPEDYS